MGDGPHCESGRAYHQPFVYVALLNRQAMARQMTARGLREGRHPVAHNVWTGRALTSAHSNVTMTVPGNSAVLLQVTSH